jgi:beta-mannosidase
MNLHSSLSHGLSRRRFLLRSAAATATLYAEALVPNSARAAAAKTSSCSLNGTWQVAKAGTDDWLPAQVPGCIHTDLLAAGKIPDPFFRDNEKSVQWIGDTDWAYRRTFTVDADFLAHQQVCLRCEGLDTLASISINGQKLGDADNMFRTWEFDAKPVLKTGENQIEIHFSSPEAFVKALEAKRGENRGVTGRAWLRKQPCQFGWDWAPTLVTSGIWRNISLVAADTARLDDVLILQDHSEQNRVTLTARVSAQSITRSALRARISVTQNGQPVAKKEIGLSQGCGEAKLALKNPKLWWPNGMGEQPLYEVCVTLTDHDGNKLDSSRQRIGLRTMELVEQQKDKPLHIAVNGVDFFAKGANWIPSDAFNNRVTPERLRQYVKDAAAANMNMLRFWGGGYYEEDALYDACDEMGICVWADFKFACASYPAFDEKFVRNVCLEARDNLKRLRHHPCIAVWCGNNEISLLVKDDWSLVSMGRDGYEKLFKQALAEQVKTYAPQSSYVSGSPDCGDVHYWEVWWGARTFEAYRELSGFMSEFGYQSYPEPRTVNSYTSADDRTSTMSDIMKWHQRCPLGNDRIKNMTGNYFRAGKDFDSTLWISQLVQAYGIKLGAEYWRQHMPKWMGCLFWQYNDCWPVASWASVDYYGRWKALHYAARHFYAPVMISGLEDDHARTVAIYLTSDLAGTRHGTVSWRVTDLQGALLKDGTLNVLIAPRQSQVVQQLDLKSLVDAKGRSNLLVWLKLETGKGEVSRNLVTFARPKDIELLDPNIKTEVTKAAGGFRVTVMAEKPALWAWLSLGEKEARYSDNFVHLDAQSPAEIIVNPGQPMSREECEQALVVRSLFDTYTRSAQKA